MLTDPSHGGTHIIVNRPGDAPHRAILERRAESGDWCLVREDQGEEWVPAEWVLPIEARPAHTAEFMRDDCNDAAWMQAHVFIDRLMEEAL